MRLTIRLALFPVLLLGPVASFAANIPPDSIPGTLSFLFVGDVMGHSPQISSAYDSVTHTYRYDSVFCRMAPVFGLADVTIANLEVTLAGKPFTGYPQFSSPDALAQSLKDAGVDIVVTANNHSAARGKKGSVRTIKVLDSLGIPHTGTFLDSVHRDSVYPLVIERKGFRFALLNYTYGTNGIPVPSPVIVNPIDTALIRADYRKALSRGVDEVIVFLHWGNEYERTPGVAQRRVSEFCHRLGIRTVIGSHPHVIQRMEATPDTDSTRGKVVVFSLGNFVSNQRDQFRDGGVLSYIRYSRGTSSVKIDRTGYILSWVHIPIRNGRKTYQVLPVSQYEIKSNYFNDSDYKLLSRFASDSRRLLNDENAGFPEIVFSPDMGEWLIP